MTAGRTPLTLVFGFRDRDPARIRRSLDSLARQSFSDFRVVFVDYGSDAATAVSIRSLVEGYEFCDYLYSDTRGLPWNRARALNTGARRAESEFVMTTDIDILFPPDFLATVIEEVSPAKVLYCYHHFLPKDFSDWDRFAGMQSSLRPAGKTALGPCQVVATAVYHRLRGFDEYYRYWGIEDRDFHHRLTKAGLREVWVNDRTAIYHQWHPPVDWETDGFMPDGLWPRMQTYFYRSRDRLVRNTESWGRLLAPEDRPVFGFLDFESRSLLEDDRLERFDPRCDSGREAGKLVSAFWELPPGHALAVAGASFPGRRGWADGLLRLANGALRRAGTSTRIGYPPNVVHSFVAELAESAADQLGDLYLDFPANGGVSLLVRA